MPSIDEIADEYVARAATLDPFMATCAGIGGHDDELPDLSVDGFAERAGLDRSTLAALDAAEAPALREQIARAAMRERLALAVERYDAGDTTSELNVAAGWVQDVRELFDLMPTDGEEASANIAKRMAAVPDAYRRLSATLLDAARKGRPPARLQVEEVAKQCAAWAEPGNPFYSGLAERLTGVPDSMRGELDAAAREATAATAGLGAFLSRELLPLARDEDACGPEVYARASRYFLGAVVDLAEAYAWSWEEIPRLRAEQAQVSNLIRPGATREEAVAVLEQDPARRIQGRENFRAWMQELAEDTIAKLHGAYFDIPEPAHRIEATIAPTSEGGIYYIPPSEDWSRPGRIAELGYLDDPGLRLGLLGSQLMNTAVAVLDIGVHLDLEIPKGTGWREGQRWNAQIAWEFLRAHSSWDERQLRFELHRYLGWPGQAPAYKLGGRIWLQAREEAAKRAGGAFSLKDFHSRALALGSMGLDPLRDALARI